MLKSHAPEVCFQNESSGMIGGFTMSVSPTVDAVAAKPQRAGVTQDIWSSGARPVTGIRPPENTNCDMIATTSSGMICSLDLANADSARPTVAAHTVAAAIPMNNSMVAAVSDEPRKRPPFLGVPTPMSVIAVTMLDCTIANTE